MQASLIAKRVELQHGKMTHTPSMDQAAWGGSCIYKPGKERISTQFGRTFLNYLEVEEWVSYPEIGNTYNENNKKIDSSLAQLSLSSQKGTAVS